jgi:hypothetical protein
VLDATGRAQAGQQSLAVFLFVRGQLRHGPSKPGAESSANHADIQNALLNGIYF